MAKTTLAFLLILFASISAIGQALPKSTHVVGGCNEDAAKVLTLFQEAAAAPRFDLYVICDPAQWHTLAIRNDFKETSFSFTVLHKGMIWFGPKAISTPTQIRESVRHELEHLRCDCDLGEGH